MTTNLDETRSNLEKEYERLSEELEQLRASRTGENRREGSPFGKREEEASETVELEKQMVMEERLSEQISAIEHALKKFEEGTYGLCDNCGQPIDPARLEAIPQASLCMKCKSELSKHAKNR